MGLKEHYTRERILRMKERKGKAFASPAPFPGKYPTKLYVEIYGVASWAVPHTIYLGVPNRQIGAKLAHAWGLRSTGQILLVEFDRKHVVRSSHVGEPYQVGFRANAWNERLLPYYYPWHAERQFWNSLVDPVWVKSKIRLGARLLKVYSPRERLRTYNDVLPFKSWVTEQKFWEAQAK